MCHRLYTKYMHDSIFTKIIKGEIPCHKVYEDSSTLAFLDIHPVTSGMTLVVPKVQVANIEDLTPDTASALWQTVQKVAKRLRKAYPKANKIAIQVEGLDVDHAHVKLFPINTAQDFRKTANMSAEPDHEALTVVAKQLAF